MRSSAEHAFIQSIDCSFPYFDADATKRLIQQGCATGSNAAFMLVYELCNVPVGLDVPKTLLLNLLDYWGTQFEHDLKAPIEALCRRHISGEAVNRSALQTFFVELEAHPNELVALNIAYSIAYRNDCDDEAERSSEKVKRAWRQMKNETANTNES